MVAGPVTSSRPAKTVVPITPFLPSTITVAPVSMPSYCLSTITSPAMSLSTRAAPLFAPVKSFLASSSANSSVTTLPVILLPEIVSLPGTPPVTVRSPEIVLFLSSVPSTTSAPEIVLLVKVPSAASMPLLMTLPGYFAVSEPPAAISAPASTLMPTVSAPPLNVLPNTPTLPVMTWRPFPLKILFFMDELEQSEPITIPYSPAAALKINPSILKRKALSN